MEYKNSHQARFSKGYLLVIGENEANRAHLKSPERKNCMGGASINFRRECVARG